MPQGSDLECPGAATCNFECPQRALRFVPAEVPRPPQLPDSHVRGLAEVWVGSVLRARSLFTEIAGLRASRRDRLEAGPSLALLTWCPTRLLRAASRWRRRGLGCIAPAFSASDCPSTKLDTSQCTSIMTKGAQFRAEGGPQPGRLDGTAAARDERTQSASAQAGARRCSSIASLP